MHGCATIKLRNLVFKKSCPILYYNEKWVKTYWTYSIGQYIDLCSPFNSIITCNP